MVERNLNALENILQELNVDCNVRSEETMARSAAQVNIINFIYLLAQLDVSELQAVQLYVQHVQEPGETDQHRGVA